MNKCVFIILVVASLAPAKPPATKPASQPSSPAVASAQIDVSNARQACLDRVRATPDYLAAKKTADESLKVLEDARQNGTTEQRLSASSTYTRLASVLKKMEDDAVEADGGVKAANDHLAQARDEFAQQIKNEMQQAKADRDAETAAEQQRMKDPIYRAMKEGKPAVGMTEEQVEKAVKVHGYKSRTTYTSEQLKIVEYGPELKTLDGPHLLKKYSITFDGGKVGAIADFGDPFKDMRAVEVPSLR